MTFRSWWDFNEESEPKHSSEAHPQDPSDRAVRQVELDPSLLGSNRKDGAVAGKDLRHLRAPGAFWRLGASEQGDGLIEFAIVAGVLFTCLFGIMGVSEAGYAYHFTSYAAREATRYALVRGSTWGTATCASPTTSNCNATSVDVQNFVKSIVTPGINSGSGLVVTTTWPGSKLAGSMLNCYSTNGNNSPGCLVKVQVSYSFSYSMPFLPTAPLVLKSTSQVVVMQ